MSRWLKLRGFEVDVLVAGQRGYDISARHPDNDQQWVIEAKGGTSSIACSKAYGRNYGRNDANIRVAQAFWLASRWTSRSALADFNIGIAIPASKHFDVYS